MKRLRGGEEADRLAKSYNGAEHDENSIPHVAAR
jgi:hypothetical protein